MIYDKNGKDYVLEETDEFKKEEYKPSKALK